MIQASPSEPAIELVSVSKRYGAFTALDHLSLTVPRGTTLGLIGPNGAGKSTTIRILMGLLSPSAGDVRVLGLDVATQAVEVRRQVGYVPERHDIYPWMSVKEVISFVTPFYPTWDVELCQEMIDLYKVDTSKVIRTLSKGMFVKVALILAISHRPELLVLDEPTSGLDPIAHEDFLSEVTRFTARAGTTVLYSSHNLADIVRIANSVCILQDGCVVVQRAISELLASTKQVRAVLVPGSSPRWAPEGTISQEFDRGEWRLTVDGFGPDTAERIKAENPVESLDVFDMNLSELFRDFILAKGKPHE